MFFLLSLLSFFQQILVPRYSGKSSVRRSKGEAFSASQDIINIHKKQDTHKGYALRPSGILMFTNLNYSI